MRRQLPHPDDYPHIRPIRLTVELVRAHCNLSARCVPCGWSGVFDGRRLYHWFVTTYGYDNFEVCRRKLVCPECGNRSMEVRPTLEPADDALPPPDERSYAMNPLTISRGY